MLTLQGGQEGHLTSQHGVLIFGKQTLQEGHLMSTSQLGQDGHSMLQLGQQIFGMLQQHDPHDPQDEEHDPQEEDEQHEDEEDDEHEEDDEQQSSEDESQNGIFLFGRRNNFFLFLFLESKYLI